MVFSLSPSRLQAVSKSILIVKSRTSALPECLTGDFTLLAKRHVKREGIEDKASQLRSIVIDQFFIYLKFCQMLRSTGLLVPAVESVCEFGYIFCLLYLS